MMGVSEMKPIGKGRIAVVLVATAAFVASIIKDKKDK